jgi:hypothetical protein|nr:MAG TPA: hypothetical protein [Caudoviricetes sp.]
MTPEMTQAALSAVAEETAKAAVKRSLTITMMGHATAIAGIAAGLPAADATEAIGQVIGMLIDSRDAIGDMK